MWVRRGERLEGRHELQVQWKRIKSDVCFISKKSAILMSFSLWIGLGTGHIQTGTGNWNSEQRVFYPHDFTDCHEHDLM